MGVFTFRFCAVCSGNGHHDSPLFPVFSPSVHYRLVRCGSGEDGDALVELHVGGGCLTTWEDGRGDG